MSENNTEEMDRKHKQDMHLMTLQNNKKKRNKILVKRNL